MSDRHEWTNKDGRHLALEAVVAPLLPLVREWEEWAKRTGHVLPGTIILTAEFSVEALRALTKE